MTDVAAPKKVVSLIKTFRRNIDAYRSGGYNETQVRLEYIDPFFKALGWDVHNEEGRAEAYKDVIHEATVKVGGATKAPDYCFRIGGARKFFVEAKKPSVDIAHDIHPAYQLRRYAWSAKLPLSVLTDFEEFAVYDCRVRPQKTDKASSARILYLTYGEYEERWEEIANIFSRNAVVKGDFDKYIESTRKKRGTAEVDAAFLKEIENWRDILARNIALRNESLSVEEMNFAVQRTIDRLIFLRICEDRGIEAYGQLRELMDDDEIYVRLSRIFQRADERYNSGLFHFKRERDRPGTPDGLSLGLTVDNKVLKEIISHLYYPDCPYEFSVLPTEILGHVYEQFLGKVIRLTPAHRAKVEEKPEVRKAGGVYYTPTYIVDYIVKNTVGNLLEGSTPRKASKLKIVDPACGSGSFLIGAYQYLLDWHRDTYVEKGPGRHKDKLIQVTGGGWRLTTAEKKRILLNNIYGVDIDPQAVEVTKLSLLLKVLEGESEETIDAQLKFFHERALPDLGNNIKCGNSLIGPDFYDNEQMSLLAEEEKLKINAFDWEAEFAQVFGREAAKGAKGRQGFDCVIGNPPYVRQEMLGDHKFYFENNYATYHGIADLYTYFIERGVCLLREGGYFCYIVANKWLRANYGKPLRHWLQQRCIEEIVDFRDLPVFKGATTYPCILRIKHVEPGKEINVVRAKHLDFTSLREYVQGNKYPVSHSALGENGWSLVQEGTGLLLTKLNSVGTPLANFVKGKIYRGVVSGLNKAFVIDEETKNQITAMDNTSLNLIKPFLVGRNLKRYEPPDTISNLIVVPNRWTRENAGSAPDKWKWLCENYPAIGDHLKPFETKARKRWDKGEYWWELRPCDYYSEFQKPKIIYAELATKGQFTLDTDGKYPDSTAYVLGSSSLYLLGILNSRLLTFTFSNTSSAVRGGFLRWKRQYVSTLPIRSINLSDQEDKSRHDRMVKLVDTMLDLNKRLQTARTPHEKESLQRQIDATDKRIDQLVYKLYDLTEEEVRLIEETADK